MSSEETEPRWWCERCDGTGEITVPAPWPDRAEEPAGDVPVVCPVCGGEGWHP